MKYFSQRYHDLVFKDNGVCDDRITGLTGGYATFKKERIVKLLLKFDEPRERRVSRYNEEKEKVGAFYLALCRFDELQDHPYFYVKNDPRSLTDACYKLRDGFTPHLFDVIELQYEFLSSSEQTEFCKQFCALFKDMGLPWLVVDGRLIKIDSEQFEMDLKSETEQLMGDLKTVEPPFQPAYHELMKAMEFLERGDYSEAVINAEKCYESVLKVILSAKNERPDRLLSKISNQIELPDSVTPEGFKNSVLNSLPYLRNNLAGHGAGSNAVEISKELANLSINLACGLVTYLIEEFQKKTTAQSFK